MDISVITIRGPWTVQTGRQLMDISVFNDTWPLDCTDWTATDRYTPYILQINSSSTTISA